MKTEKGKKKKKQRLIVQNYYCLNYPFELFHVIYKYLLIFLKEQTVTMMYHVTNVPFQGSHPYEIVFDSIINLVWNKFEINLV